MGSRYFLIVAYVWLEKYFSCGDSNRQAPKKSATATAGPRP
jgi:hypothetical protein